MQVGDRTKTAEELAAAREQQLQRLEAQRVKRLRGPSGDDLGEGGSASEEEDDMTGLGGFAARRAKRRKREAAGVQLSLLCTSIAYIICNFAIWSHCSIPSATERRINTQCLVLRLPQLIFCF